MHAQRSRAATVVSVVVLGGAVAVASFVACATGGTGPQASGDDASTGSGSGGHADSSSSGGSSGSSSGGGGTCDADTQTDWTNCGGCGHMCTTGDICVASQCQAPCVAPKTSCPGEPGCFDLTSDNQNCVTCGTQCLPPAAGTVTGTASCTGSQCVFTCPTDAGVVDGGGPIVQCGADSGVPGCFDLTQSSDHCGSCGASCEGGMTCTQSQCCPPGNSYCSGTCIDVTTSATNCGGCGKSCPSPATCAVGICTGYTTTNPTAAFIDACAQTGATTVLKNQGIWKSTNLIGLPFSFTFYGVAQTQFWVQNQGTLGFGPPGGFPPPQGYPDCTAGGDPSTAYPAAVVFGAYGLATGPNGVCYATLGTAPNQQFAVTWSQVTDGSDPGSTLTFSLVLTQTTNTLDFMYQTATGADGGIDPTVSGMSATVGIQGMPGGKFAATPYSCAAAFLKSTPLVVRFTPVQ